MDLNAAAAASCALAGLGTGIAATLAFRWSERDRHRDRRRRGERYEDTLPPGVDTVLSVLSSSAVVLDGGDAVIKASTSAYAVGLVRGGALVVDELLAMARLTRRDGEIRQAEIELPRPRAHGAADPLAVSARVAPLGSRLVLLLVEDLTETRRTEAMRRDFVANVSHELKTPVGALSLLSEAVTDAADDPEAVERFAGRMQSEATRLTSLVQELIDLSRVQDDGPVAGSEPVSVEDLVTEAVERCRQRAAKKEIEIVTAETAGLYLRGDRDRLSTALGNLVENAVNYSPSGTRVALGCRPAPDTGGRRVELTVTDQGIGIPEKDRERIFERFYRVDPARSRQTGGTGLGLSIVKHVIAAHGGTISVWSVEGQGSTFTVRLPAHQQTRGGARRAVDGDGTGATPEPVPHHAPEVRP